MIVQNCPGFVQDFHIQTYYRTCPVSNQDFVFCRWTSPQRELQKVRQFSYEQYSDKDGGRDALSTMTQTQRYAEALRVTQRIASELADIDETAEFRQSLAFLEQQWRNFRQKTSEITTPRLSTSPRPAGAPGKRKSTIVKDPESPDEFEDDAMHSEEVSSDDNLVDEILSVAPKIRLNPKARKVGRPKKQKQKTVVTEKTDRKWFDAAEAGRKTSGDVTLERVLDNLDRDQPGLEETRRRLSGVLVKFSEADEKKPSSSA
jgi:hypothetical protein